MPQQATNPAPDAAAAEDNGVTRYHVREVVGLFATPADLQAAIDELMLGGFDRAQISVLGKRTHVDDHFKHLFDSASSQSLEDDAEAPRDAPDDSRAEIEAATVGVPIYLLGVGSMAVVIASGGSLALAMGALMLGGAVGGGVGGLLAHAIGKEHHERIAEQVERGGLLLWVQPRNAEQERAAAAVLKQSHASDVHVHQISREWGIRDMPLHDAQPDPLLEREPS
jgi:hypothetical protein